MRSTQRFILIAIFSAILYFAFFRSSGPPAPVIPTDDLPTSKVDKLLKWKIQKSRPVIFTVADKTDIPNVHNIRERLEPWGRKANFVVLCLDEECMNAPELGVKRIDVGMVRGGGETVIILFAHHLAMAGHSFLYMAPSICITGTHDIFQRMLKHTDDSWDVQAMEQNNKLDPGFLFARPSVGTQRYLTEAVKLKRDKKTKNLSATYILREALRTSQIRFKLLDVDDFKSWADYQDWELQHFATEEEIDVLQKGTTAIHFTCIDRSIQPYFGRLFGGWSDHNGYYSNLRGKYIRVTGIAGTTDQVVSFIALMAQVAIDTGRILILPYHADLLQKRTKEVGKKMVAQHVRVPTFPIYRVIDIISLDGIVDYAEASFSLNREKYSEKPLRMSEITATEELLTHDDRKGFPRLTKMIYEMSPADVVSVGIQGFEMRSWDFSGDKYGYIKTVKERLRICANVEEEETACAKRCT